jgi:hypothetical protein
VASFFVRGHQHSTGKFFALCVNLDKGERQVDLVSELGCRDIQIRMPLSYITNLAEYVAFARKFSGCEILINVLQDRQHIEDDELFAQSIESIFHGFAGVAHTFQIGNAINRTKWGFFSIAEYLRFYQVAQKVRDNQFAHLCLVGPAVIDYEYHFIVRALFNRFNINYDKLSSLLYVDRRGAPENTQTAIFDTNRKIDFLYALAKISRQSSNDILITEANWPISNTAPWAPTSETECVSEAQYANYLLRYYLLALATQKVESVYWHQLIAPGYGLIDDRESLRKRSAFYVYQQMLKMLKGAVVEGYQKSGHKHCLKFMNKGKRIQVIWLNSTNQEPYTTQGVAFDKLGKVIDADILLSESPIYIVGE